MRLLAKIGMARGVLDDAELLLAAMLEMVPDHSAARLDYARCLIDRHRYADARGQLDQLLALDSANLDYRALAATADVGLGRHDAAIEIYDGMLTEGSRRRRSAPLARPRPEDRRQDIRGRRRYRVAAGLRADFGDAWWSLANLKTYRFEDEEIARMRAAEGEERGHRGRFAPTYASPSGRRSRIAGSSRIRGHSTRAATPSCAPGAAIARRSSRPTPGCKRPSAPPPFFERRAGWGDPRPDPDLRLVGLPRSGSTLIEQILASHSQVEGTQELSDVQAIVLELQGRDPRSRKPEVSWRPRRPEARRRRAARRPLSRRHRRAPHRPAVLHRQDAQQLPAHRPDPPHAAGGDDHRRPPASR